MTEITEIRVKVLGPEAQEAITEIARAKVMGELIATYDLAEEDFDQYGDEYEVVFSVGKVKGK